MLVRSCCACVDTVGPFQSDALLVPDHCVFDHVHDQKQCTSYRMWNDTATATCFHRGMFVRSFSVLQPCGIDRFNGVEFVCCPYRTSTTASKNDHLCLTLFVVLSLVISSLTAILIDCVRGTRPPTSVALPAQLLTIQAVLVSAQPIAVICSFPQTGTTRLRSGSFFIAAPVVWNSLPLHLRSPSISHSQFQAGLKSDACFHCSRRVITDLSVQM